MLRIALNRKFALLCDQLPMHYKTQSPDSTALHCASMCNANNCKMQHFADCISHISNAPVPSTLNPASHCIAKKYNSLPILQMDSIKSKVLENVLSNPASFYSLHSQCTLLNLMQYGDLENIFYCVIHFVL